MLRVRPDKPVPPLLAELLRQVHGAAEALGLPYFIAGALARDLLLVHVHGFDVPRPTRDVDVGIALGNWEDFERVKSRLGRTGAFSPVAAMPHRLCFSSAPDSRGIPLDIVPFAGVQEPDGTLRWPPERAVVMDVTGFEEALASAERLLISENLVVPVASLPGQALLKLAAWLDRRNETPRDAVDLLALFRRYGDAGNMERLYDEKPGLLVVADFDVERAGAALLGEDVRAMAMSRSYEKLSKAFASPAIQDAFLMHVVSGMAATEDDRLERAQVLIHSFFTGFGPHQGAVTP